MLRSYPGRGTLNLCQRPISRRRENAYRSAMADWTQFYFMCGSAAAGLTGLMFIAITFGARLITNDKLPYVDAFFSPISYHFIQVFILCAVALMPIAGPKTLGITIVLTTAWRCLELVTTYRLTGAAARQRRYPTSTGPTGFSASFCRRPFTWRLSRPPSATSSEWPRLPLSSRSRCCVFSSSRCEEHGKCCSGSRRKSIDSQEFTCENNLVDTLGMNASNSVRNRYSKGSSVGEGRSVLEQRRPRYRNRSDRRGFIEGCDSRHRRFKGRLLSRQICPVPQEDRFVEFRD